MFSAGYERANSLGTRTWECRAFYPERIFNLDRRFYQGSCPRFYNAKTWMDEVMFEFVVGLKVCVISTHSFSVIFVLVEFFSYGKQFDNNPDSLLYILDTQITCLFVKRPPFEWSDSLFSNFMLARFVAIALGTLLVPATIRRLPLIGKESYMILAGLLCGCIGNVIFAFSRSTAVVFASMCHSPSQKMICLIFSHSVQLL